MTEMNDNKKINEEEPPPIMKSWNKLYLFLLVQTAALVVVFYLFTRFFR
jgi:hypothetical protein